jgi:hypothetical protein
MSKKFDEVYRKIADSKNYVQPNYPRMDNWAVDRYESGEYFAAMGDAGYSKWVGRLSDDGKVAWRVNSYCPKPLEFSGITEEEFEAIEL